MERMRHMFAPKAVRPAVGVRWCRRHMQAIRVIPNRCRLGAASRVPQVCRRITLYGFFASGRHGARHHYFNNEVPSNAQRDDSEYHVAAALARAGLLSFGESCVVVSPPPPSLRGASELREPLSLRGNSPSSAPTLHNPLREYSHPPPSLLHVP